jgi:hypothetical protein
VFGALELNGGQPMWLQGLNFLASCLSDSRKSGCVKPYRKNFRLPNQARNHPSAPIFQLRKTGYISLFLSFMYS